MTNTKKIYIQGTSCLSPQKTFDSPHLPDEIFPVVSNRLSLADPVYKEYIPPDMVRRMSRVIKMGVATAKRCLADAGNGIPEAIITGTGLGCIQDTEKFLAAMILNNEEFLTPTSFIQSTHNTVSAQIALLLKCHGYNFTYVNRGFSFESALLDSLIKLETGQLNRLLLGVTDELTDHSFHIQYRLGMWKQKPVTNIKILEDLSRGTIAGEGAAFFFLESEPKPSSYAIVNGVSTLLNPESPKQIQSWIRRFLEEQGLVSGQIGLLLLGLNGYPESDRIYYEIAGAIFPKSPKAYFKHLCGEYHTATGFATWLGATILKQQAIPPIILLDETDHLTEHILIYNHYMGIDHSLILLSKV